MTMMLQEFVPAEWRGAVTLLTTPLRWIPEWQTLLVNIAWSGGMPAEIAGKRIFLLLPCLVLLAAVWCTMAALYTLPFRSGRGGFLTALLMAWWDAGRCIWLYWAGIARLAVALLGWTWSLIRFIAHLAVRAVATVFRSPLTLLDWTSRKYFQPGVPWLAFLLLLLWSGVEATIFTFTLHPTLSEMLSGLTGFEPNPRVMAPILWVFLVVLVSGSFACVQVLTDAVKQRKPGEIIQMALVESSVMFFEVMFLYRELVDAVTPWIAQQSGGQVHVGLAATIGLACFGWLGVRGMTWFLFGRFGTPALLSILSRQTITRDAATIESATPVESELWRAPVAALKAETAWFKAEARELFGLMSIPVLQLLAASINFAVVTVQSRPAFGLPFASLDEMLAAAPFAATHGTAVDAAPRLTLRSGGAPLPTPRSIAGVSP
ncbi:MAG: hypothetical protein NVS1B4_02780 [Gemmatimonadaceae bacterium]